MYLVERGKKVVEIPDTDPRWRAMPKSARLQFIEGRLADLSDEEAFDGLGLPAKPLEDPRWERLTAAQQVEFLQLRLGDTAEEDAFTALGHPAPRSATPEEESEE